jgi:trigger factor
LKIEIQPREDHQVTLIVELGSDQMESAKHRAARKISERKAIPGFRPGKAPYEVVVRNFGANLVSEEAVDLLLDEVYPKALEEAKLEPASAGSLEKVEDLEKKPKFTFIVPLVPTINLGDYRSIRIPYDWIAPDKNKEEEAVNELRRMYAKTEAVNRPIEAGDFVLVDLKGERKNASVDNVPAIDRPGLPVFVNSMEKEDEFPFKGFSQELIGLSVDARKSFNHKFKKDFKDENLQGQVIKFDVKIKMVRGSILPTLDDDFAKQVGPFENIQALRAAVNANLATQSKAEFDDEFYSKIIERIKEKAEIKYPPQVLEHELEHVIKDLKGRLSEQGLDLPAYLKSRDMEENIFIEKEAKPIALKRLERSLILDELAKLEKIEISKELLQSTFEQTWGEFQGDAGFKKLMRGKSQPPKQMMNNVAMESANRAYIQQTLNRLKEIATGQALDLEENESKISGVKKPAKTTSRKNKNISYENNPESIPELSKVEKRERISKGPAKLISTPIKKPSLKGKKKSTEE